MRGFIVMALLAALLTACQRERPQRYRYTIVSWGKDEWVSSASGDKLFYHESQVVVRDATGKRYRVVLVMVPNEDDLRSSGLLDLKKPLPIVGGKVYQSDLSD